MICNRAADVRRNPSGLEAGGSSRAGPFLACMEVNGKVNIDESDEAKKTTLVPTNLATFASSVSLKPKLKPRPMDCTAADFPVSEVGQLDSSKWRI